MRNLMMTAAWVVTGLWACLGMDSGAESPATQASRPAASGPATRAPSSGDAEVDRLLDRLEARGAAIQGLSCELEYRYIVTVPVESAQVKNGELLFARGQPNARFRLHFDRMTADGVVQKRDEYFLFDGEWMTERNDKAKTIIKRQILRPGQRIDPFRLGKGPFPLPFGQTRADILGNFRVKRAEFQMGDPRNTVHLECIPRPATEMAEQYSRVHLFVDRKLDLPVRIITERLQGGSRIEVDFEEIDTSAAPAGSWFRIEEPEGFAVTREELPPGPDETGRPPAGKAGVKTSTGP